ncbi:unannotated protein [freshwater metagenome]|uniref:Unannotated protein n=1 Tax=freshwater metagenome TaxID=449393 RepID=A0A6J6L0Q6_9ZZZZ
MLVTAPAGVVTVNFAVVDVANASGKTKVTTTEVAAFDLIVTPETPVSETAVAPARLVPVMVTVLIVVAFLVPLVGVKLVIVGAISSAVLGDTPAGVVTVIVPDVAPTGTLTVTLVKVAAAAGATEIVVDPTNLIAVAPRRLVPVMVIVAPTSALPGPVMAPAGK